MSPGCLKPRLLWSQSTISVSEGTLGLAALFRIFGRLIPRWRDLCFAGLLLEMGAAGPYLGTAPASTTLTVRC